ncbi:MAG: YraN family protein [Chlorobiaceae bacterium]|nr:YraN family protein [Chlorobiaceae bacterium]
MHDPQQLGQQGEQLAADFLEKKGYRIISRNYRYHRNEIDIIARYKGTLCFIEVKTRSSTEKGHPAEAVTPGKQKEIIKAARAYLAFCVHEECDCRFDVIAILIESMHESGIDRFTVEHFEDAFWAD